MPLPAWKANSASDLALNLDNSSKQLKDRSRYAHIRCNSQATGSDRHLLPMLKPFSTVHLEPGSADRSFNSDVKCKWVEKIGEIAVESGI
jgi:hypothetical protein